MWPTSFWLYQAGRSGGELILSKLTFLLILVRFVQSKHLGQLTLSAIEVKLNSFSAHLSTGKFCSGSGTCLPFRPMRRAWFLRLVTSHSPAQAGGHYGHCRQLPPASCPELGAFKPPKKAKSLHPEVMRCHIRLCTDLPGPSWNGKIQNGSIWTSSVGAPITVSFLHRWLLPDSLSKTVLKGPEGWKSARKKMRNRHPSSARTFHQQTLLPDKMNPVLGTPLKWVLFIFPSNRQTHGCLSTTRAAKSLQVLLCI